MMSAPTLRIKEVRQKLIEQDRDKVIYALAELFHYRVAPRATYGEEVLVFADEKALKEFSEEKELMQNALNWMLSQLKDEGLSTSTSAPISLTARGVERYCL